tara:strand:- start:4288 stop:5502 length:1215 start_codon:yes stop_codon:yes gene_type:complete
MTVTVSWVQKKKGDNHLPKFRPTDTDALDKAERHIYRSTLAAMDRIPEDFSRRYIFNEVNETRAMENLIAELLPAQEDITLAIFAVYVQGANDMAYRIRDSINAELRRLGSNARLTSINEMTKALDSIPWEPYPWDATIPPLDLFNQQPDNMPAKVYARFRSGLIIDSVVADVQANIETVIARGFTAQQTFNTGRTVTGLTPQQTARSLFGLLQEVSPVPITGADYAAKIVPNTNGLFPRWALAVDRSMNRYAENLSQTPRIGAKEIIRRTDNHGQRYGNKLRRARARMIARTETAYAQNRGALDTMLQVQTDGLVGPTTMKEWVTGPVDVCEICQPMGGRKVLLNQSFNWGTGMGAYPPAHPNCRCKIDMVPNLSQPPTKLGTGAINDPNRYRFPDGFEITSF